LLGVVTPSMEVYASPLTTSWRWTYARLQSIGTCGLLRRLSLFKPSSMRVKTGLANPVECQKNHPIETSYATDWIPPSEFTEASRDIPRLFTISHLSASICNGCTPSTFIV